MRRGGSVSASGRRRCLIAALVLATAAVAPAAVAMDLYIGTLSLREGEVVLERCDLARTRYALRDAEGAAAVDALRRAPAPAGGFWYGEVIGDYVENGDGHGLMVAAIEGLEPGRSCHLLDALDAASDATDTPSAPAEGRP